MIVITVRLKPDTTEMHANRESKAERVAANGRPLGRAGDLAVVRERFAEHPNGLFADRPRPCLPSIRRSRNFYATALSVMSRPRSMIANASRS